MGLGNQGGGGNSGNKRSNHNFEHRELQILGEQLTALAGLATEGTLISVLNAIVASDQDIEILLVRVIATGEVLQQITNYETGVPVVEYKDVNGVVIPSPGPVEYLDPSAVLNLMLTEMLAQGLSLDAIVTSTGLSATEVTAALINSNTVLGNITLNNLLNQTGLAPTSVVTFKLNSAGPTNSVFAAANVLRRSLKVTNNSDFPIYLKEGTVTTSSSFTWIIEEGETVIIDDYNGQVDGSWLGVIATAGTGALITETTF
tara:strand:+ start:1769 stop:2545 length:777 start_codon:yes stop_codon:yes gene_type:complete